MPVIIYDQEADADVDEQDARRRQGVPLVWELSSRVSSEDIRAARKLWMEKFPQTLA